MAEAVAGDLREDSGCGPNTDSWHAAQDRMDTFGLKNKMEVELIRKIKQKKNSRLCLCSGK